MDLSNLSFNNSPNSSFRAHSHSNPNSHSRSHSNSNSHSHAGSFSDLGGSAIVPNYRPFNSQISHSSSDQDSSIRDRIDNFDLRRSPLINYEGLDLLLSPIKIEKKEENNIVYPREIFINDDLAEDLLCSICQNIPDPETAREVLCCGHLFCEICLLNWTKRKNDCPLCKQSFEESEGDYVKKMKDNNKILYKRFKRSAIKCPNQCPWKGTLENYQTHIQECPNRIVPCPFDFYGCSFKGRKDLMNEHEKSNGKFHLNLVYKMKNNNKKNCLISGRVRMHQHPLEFIKSGTWSCSMAEECSGRKKDIYGPRFCCQLCNFNLCNSCFYENLEKES